VTTYLRGRSPRLKEKLVTTYLRCRSPRLNQQLVYGILDRSLRLPHKTRLQHFSVFGGRAAELFDRAAASLGVYAGGAF